MLELLRPVVAEELARFQEYLSPSTIGIDDFAASVNALSALTFSFDRQYPTAPVPSGLLAPLVLLTYLAMDAQSGPGPPFHDPVFHSALSIAMIDRMGKTMPLARQRLAELRGHAEAVGLLETYEIWSSPEKA